MRTHLFFLYNRVGAPMKNECVGAHSISVTLVRVCRHVKVNSVLFNFQNLFSHGHWKPVKQTIQIKNMNYLVSQSSLTLSVSNEG